MTYSLEIRPPNGDVFYGDSPELYLFGIIQDHIVNCNRYKQSKAKWRAYTAYIPIILLQIYELY